MSQLLKNSNNPISRPQFSDLLAVRSSRILGAAKWISKNGIFFFEVVAPTRFLAPRLVAAKLHSLNGHAQMVRYQLV